jgi:pyruvate/2-oxoglutarate dehydrogenase complex dihydrolipoamide dehydrogenase (E3) component
MTTLHGSADYGDKIAVGMFRCVANGQPVMQDETAGRLKSINQTPNGELAGLAMVGPRVADMVEARVFALDADAAVETLTGGPAPDSTHSEAAGAPG